MSTVSEFLDALLEQGPEGVGRFAASLDPEWIDAALAATGKASIRRRKLPAEQAVWLVLGMCVFADKSIRDVVDHLGLVVPGVESLAPSSVVAARSRLGAEPMAWLFRRVAEEWADSSSGLEPWRGLTLHAVDGTCLRVWDSDENFDRFGKPGGRGGPNDAGYPQVRLTCLLNLQTRMIRAAAFGPFKTSEHELAGRLWAKLSDDSLTILDRGFIDYRLFASLVSAGCNRHLLVRMRRNLKYEPIELLPDGSELAYIKPHKKLIATDPTLPAALTVRVVHYQHDGGEPNRLLTTLLDPEAFPAEELIELYHQRWEIELAYDELKTHMIERRECLRSRTPDGVEQEVHGLLLTYNLVRREMLLAAQSHDLPPRRISFRSSLMWVRNFWQTAWTTRSPGNIPKHLDHFRSTLDVLILPERRSERRYPRHVKIKMSNFPRNRGKRGTAVVK
ncbi:MAG: IS4 family transposase [Vicinamibacterales bacterium]|nr:IS4 family transposase [Vicinamibacterales bacterium]